MLPKNQVPAGRVVGPVAHETTDVEDIQALAEAIVSLVGTAAYDDMTWNEVQHSFMRASALIRANWAATGTVAGGATAPARA